MSDFVSAFKNVTDSALPNVSKTENGATGLKTTGKNLLDVNFMLSSMRNMKEDEIWGHFLLAYNENPMLSILWLFFVRDREQGCGERRSFRVIFKRLCCENMDVAIKVMHLIPFYGRWDDLTDILFADVPCKIRNEAFSIVDKQLNEDLIHVLERKPVSLLAKWLPSLNTSSRNTRKNANMLCNMLGWSPKKYRKSLVTLRSALNVVEKDMSANQWGKINYEAVPSRAAMNYRKAFMRHDTWRYTDYLDSVNSGKAKINANTLFPHDIVHAYGRNYFPNNATLEAQWNALPNTVPDNNSTLVVVDGSGSMCVRLGNTNITAHDVARALGLYFAERLHGAFRNTFVTFSSNPRLIHFDNVSLGAKLFLIDQYDECSNTNIEKVFDLVLQTAVDNHMKQEEIPANILIVSDMEFDQATYRGGWGWNLPDCDNVDQTLFDAIARRWKKAGYKLPRLVFWNVMSRTGTIPVAINELGVALVSGFSPNIADMVMSAELDPYQCLVKKLMGERYKPVEQALKE